MDLHSPGDAIASGVVIASITQSATSRGMMAGLLLTETSSLSGDFLPSLMRGHGVSLKLQYIAPFTRTHIGVRMKMLLLRG